MPRRPLGPGGLHDRCVHVAYRNMRLVLWVSPRYRPIRLRRAEVWRGDRWQEYADRVEVLSMPRNLTGEAGGGILAGRSKPKLFEKFPELSSWMSDAAYQDGKPVGMVQLSIRPKGAVFVATLRIQDQGGMMLQVEDVSLDDTLILLEAALMASPVPWSRDPYPLGQITGKKK